MQTFIQQLAELITENHSADTADICVVMPNRRAGLYLRKSLADLYNKPVFAPRIFSIGDFFCEISGFRLLDEINLLFELYEIHRRIEPEYTEKFEEFIRWAPMLLQDINELDANLTDAPALFGYLSEAKAIERWNPGIGGLTDAEKEYIRFFQSLGNYYTAFRNHLTGIKAGYQGLINRHVAEKADQFTGNLPWKKIYFAGFNALTKAEEVFTGELMKEGKAEMLWDADEYYMNDARQEAGFFLRKASGKTGNEFRWQDSHFRSVKKDIRIYGIAKKAGQARFAAQLIGKVLSEVDPDKKSLDDIAVVLADESLLMPLLNALPEELNDFNLTMGYPLRQAPLYQLLQYIFRLFENSGRFAGLKGKENNGFYFADLLRIFQHPYLKSFIDTHTITDAIRKSNRIFYSPAEVISLTEHLQGDFKKTFKPIFENVYPEPVEIVEKITRLLGGLRDQITVSQKNTGHSNIDLEYLYHFARVNTRLRDLNEKYRSIKNSGTLRQIFSAIAGKMRIPFSGEPLKGLQIMGMLETRNLDFKNVILLAANEGQLPAASPGNSFIPWDIQREFGLPTWQEKNAVFAYHFYRLMQRAEKIHITYDTEPSDLGGGEPSRFIRQLVHEMPDYQPETKINQSVVNISLPEKTGERTISIEKNNQVFEALKSKAKKGLSPTSLNRFRNCPLQFYFHDIAGLEEAEEVEETLEARTMGSVVHRVLEEMFSPYTGQELKPEFVGQMASKKDDLIKAALKDLYAGGDLTFGKNRLIAEVIGQLITRYLESEKKWLKEIRDREQTLFLKKPEEKIETEFDRFSNHIRQVTLKGTIDRVDQLDGITRIIDYKTGRIDSSAEFRFKSWDDFLEKSNTGKAFQVLFYAWLYDRTKKPPEKKYESGVIGLRKLSEGFIRFNFKPKQGSQPETLIDIDLIGHFEELLRDILDEIFNPDIPFIQTDDRDICKNCLYRNICMR